MIKKREFDQISIWIKVSKIFTERCIKAELSLINLFIILSDIWDHIEKVSDSKNRIKI